MIYTARKNGHTRIFSDADGMKKLLHYRRNRWQITATPGQLAKIEEAKPHPASPKKEKPQERRERRFTRVMGYRVVLD